jgi:hypothetical protein
MRTAEWRKEQQCRNKSYNLELIIIIIELIEITVVRKRQFLLSIHKSLLSFLKFKLYKDVPIFCFIFFIQLDVKHQ